jgi:drug/metabolite transporter (DMT)-like permease
VTGLLLASAIWAFSFGLIGNALAGMPPALVAGCRLALALFVFAPFARRRAPAEALALAAIGGVQFGLMYLCYNASFRYLPSHAVALFTVSTPIYVTMLCDARERRLNRATLVAALLAVLGGAVVMGGSARPASVVWRGVLLVQGANLCFAAGQVAYRDWTRRRPAATDASSMAWLYLGATLVVLPPAVHAWAVNPVPPPPRQLAVLLYLGVVASGLGFFLWNAGARRASAGVMAVCNNLKIPLAASVSLVFFHEQADPLCLGFGVVLLGLSLLLAKRAEQGTGARQQATGAK